MPLIVNILARRIKESSNLSLSASSALWDLGLGLLSFFPY
jgi:hypothetical protein